MGLARKLEQRLEQLVDGLSAAIFRGGMHPVELAGRLVRHADLSVRETDTGPVIPNVYTLRINPKDVAAEVDPSALDHEVTRTLALTAAERGWRTGGPISVHIHSDPDVTAGSIGIESQEVPGELEPWAHLIDVSDGTAFPLCDNRVVIGRSSSADVTLGNAEVSRRHSLVFRKAGSVWVMDLGSANGTLVNGNAVDGEPQSLHPGDQITFGSATLALRFV